MFLSKSVLLFVQAAADCGVVVAESLVTAAAYLHVLHAYRAGTESDTGNP